MKKPSRIIVLTPDERRWEQKFAALAKYQRKHGHCLVLQKLQGSASLANWAAEQRAAWRNGEMRAARFRRLNQLGFAWDYREGLWEQRYKELKAFRRKHGHCQVTNCSKEYSTLGNWVHFQRIQKRKGRLSPKRARRLREIGFDWISRGRSIEYRNPAHWDNKWDRMFSVLAKFKERHGHCWVPLAPSRNARLSRWVASQRKLKRQGLLKKQRQRRLEELGFDWRSASAASLAWEKRFQQLQEFNRRFGHSHVPAEWAENLTLGGWVVKMRRLRLKGRLSPDKVRRLNRIGFVWDPLRKREIEHDVIWSQWLEKLVAFHQKNGHWCVPTDQRRFHHLRIWMDNQRISYREDSLSANRIRRLNKARFPWLSDRQRLSSGA